MLTKREVLAAVGLSLILALAAPSQAGLIIDLSYNGYGGAVPITATGSTTIAIKAIVSGTSTAAGSTGVQTVVGSLYLANAAGASGQAIDGNINLSWGSYGFNATGYAKGYASDIDADGFKEMIGSTIATRQQPGSTVGRPLVGFNASGMQTNAEGSDTLTVQMANLVLSAVNLGTGAGVGTEKATTVKFVYAWSGNPSTPGMTAATWRMDGVTQNGTGPVSTNNLTFYIPYATAQITTPARKVFTGATVAYNGAGAKSVYNPNPLVYNWDTNGDGQTDASGPGFDFVNPALGHYTVRLQTVASHDSVDTLSTWQSQTLDVYEHATPVFASNNSNTLDIDLGDNIEVDDTGTLTATFKIANLFGHPYAVGLDYTGSVESDDAEGRFSLATSPFMNIASGQSSDDFTVTMLLDETGSFNATYTITSSDSMASGVEGAGPRGVLTLTIHGVVVPEPATLSLLVLGGALLAARSRRRLA